MSRILRFFIRIFRKRIKFAKEGENFRYAADCIFNSPSMMELGDDCSIGPHGVFYSVYKRIIFGNHVMLGPGVTMISGDHSIRKIGIPISLNQEKLPTDDADIVVQDDVWIGANVTVLKGVTIGRGAVVAAGSVLTRSVLPYLVVGGVPAKAIANRFSIEQVLEHERMLYSPNERLKECQLQHLAIFVDKNE